MFESVRGCTYAVESRTIAKLIGTKTPAVIAAEVASEGFLSLKAPVKLVCALDATIPYSEPMEEYLLPDEAKVVAAVREVLSPSAVTA